MSYRDAELRAALRALAECQVSWELAETQADVSVALGQMKPLLRRALYLEAAGYPMSDIAFDLTGKRSSHNGTALVAQAFADLKEKLSGPPVSLSARADRADVRRQDQPEPHAA